MLVLRFIEAAGGGVRAFRVPKVDGDLVLVTGISGFVAKHVAHALLTNGYRVRGTVRYASKREHMLRTFRSLDIDPSRIEIVKADLGADEGWMQAASGCRYVQHVASPFPRRLAGAGPELTALARGGTLRVMKAAEAAGVERVVLTSSVAAIYYGHDDRRDDVYSESDFSNVESPTIGAYAVSKTLAERAAWDFAANARLQLATINPALVLGPLLDDEFGTSVSFVRSMMQGRLPVVPRLSLNVVDVRDAAEAHRRAMVVPEAAGRRFLASGGALTLRQFGRVIGDAAPHLRWRLPKATVPDAIVRLAARLSSDAAQAVPELGRAKRLDTEPAHEILDLAFGSGEAAVAATVRSLAERGLVRRKRG